MNVLLSSILRMIGGDVADKSDEQLTEIANTVKDVLDALLLPIIIIVGVAGVIYCIILGVQFSKADGEDKRKEMKKKFINAIIGIVIALLILIIMKIFTENAEAITSWISKGGEA